MLVPTAVLPTTKLEAFWPKMPLFGSTFSPKKTPPRKSASLSNLHNLDRSTREVELGLDYGTPTMNLAGQSLKFENGQWIAETGIGGGVDRREAQRLRRRNQQLEEENNLLRLKVDILLDMMRKRAQHGDTAGREGARTETFGVRRGKFGCHSDVGPGPLCITIGT
ncbi:protein chibby homolog 1 isoform X2 [Hippopotamus amphibius kiboko]|uniref:protein chibby homolog 1 isoform X2 n=1 Tax=Hippopotamus amphibius kiboko TaxID=575201 RepID=UPI0025913E7D|nr:protein chibby homolog 1 isoform X2 [Hippopotamus amphibius kiboko]XP_057599722.1 protein chibby homolog 1 isoform X2 [Hippopotamus amphibius kiboko]XP_057599723.1 protein chibby homolog 1 isoform X2 [Hippopotamus amphibius kiboko]